MPRELIQLDTSRPFTKILVILMLILALVWAFFACRWYLGNTLAEYFNTQLNDVEMAKLAVSLAPNDPLTHWRLGQVYQTRLPQDQQHTIISEFQTAVNLSPNDYRLWTSLGTAYEQLGNAKQAERALRQAVSLAPSYAYPHWYLGNLLLRGGRYDEAFTELRQATDANPELNPQLFNLVFQVHGNDLKAMRKAIGESPGVQAEFAVYLFEQKRFDDGLLTWTSLTGHEKKENRERGNSIVTTLIGLKRFHDAINVWNSLAPTQEAHAALDSVVDGGFESPLGRASETPFGWRVSAAPQMQIGVDANKSHSGARSLRLVFKAGNKLDMINVSQLVPVQPGTQYDFEYYVRTAKLQTATPPFVQIVDTLSGAVLGASAAAPDGDNEWISSTFSFKTAEKTEAVTVRLAREPCGEEQVCPIFGTVWYDDFSIKRHY